jgi:hypothetical protein
MSAVRKATKQEATADQKLLERLSKALEATGLLHAELVVPDTASGWPALNLYPRGRGTRYPADSVWRYDAGEQLPGSVNAGRQTIEPVYVWGGSFEYTFPTVEAPAIAAGRIIATLDDRELLTTDDEEA